MNTSQARRLSDNEQRLIERLLGVDFPGREALSEQINKSLVNQIDRDGSLSFDVKTNLKANVTRRIPIEGEFEDIDGVTIHVLLHVVNGTVNELEIYKEDGSPIIKMPDPTDLRLVQLD